VYYENTKKDKHTRRNMGIKMMIVSWVVNLIDTSKIIPWGPTNKRFDVLNYCMSVNLRGVILGQVSPPGVILGKVSLPESAISDGPNRNGGPCMERDPSLFHAKPGKGSASKLHSAKEGSLGCYKQNKEYARNRVHSMNFEYTNHAV
jgi:hypothetical protein